MFHFSDNSRYLGLICSDNLSGGSYELFYSACRYLGLICSDNLSGGSYELFYSACLTNFFYQLSAEV